MRTDRPLEEGQYTLDDVASGWTYTVQIDDRLISGWARTEDQAKSRVRAVIDRETN